MYDAIKGMVESSPYSGCCCGDIIHVHGWMASLLPLYLKNYFANEPLFENSKIVTSVYNQGFEGNLADNCVDKIKFDGIEEEQFSDLTEPNYTNLMKVAINHSDALIIGSDDLPAELSKVLMETDKPVLKYHSKEDFSEAYLDFYQNQVLD